MSSHTAPTRLDDAQALQEAAAHVGGTYPGAATLMRRCATRLYQDLAENQRLRDALVMARPYIQLKGSDEEWEQVREALAGDAE